MSDSPTDEPCPKTHKWMSSGGIQMTSTDASQAHTWWAGPNDLTTKHAKHSHTWWVGPHK